MLSVTHIACIRARMIEWEKERESVRVSSQAVAAFKNAIAKGKESLNRLEIVIMCMVYDI